MKTSRLHLSVVFFCTFVTVAGIALSTTGCQPNAEGKKFTPEEKKAMMVKSTPPPAMQEMMSKRTSGPPTGKETSPWSKPQGK